MLNLIIIYIFYIFQRFFPRTNKSKRLAKLKIQIEPERGAFWSKMTFAISPLVILSNQSQS